MTEFTPPSSPPTPPGRTAADRVATPAILLIVLGVIGVVVSLCFLALYALGVSFAPFQDMDIDERWMQFLGTGFGVFFSLIGLASAVVILYAGMRMKELRNWTLAMVASILSIVPCLTPCCLLGVPVGIWCLIVLLDAEVKAAFR